MKIWEQDYFGIGGLIFWIQCWLENCLMFIVVSVVLWLFQRKMDADHMWNQHPGINKRDWRKLKG